MEAKRIKQLISKTKKSQKDIAFDLGLSQQRFNNYVTGQRDPDLAMLCVLADYFGVSVDYILGREQEKPAPDERDGLTETERRLLDFFAVLNAEGREKLLDYADDLACSGKYIQADKAKMA